MLLMVLVPTLFANGGKDSSSSEAGEEKAVVEFVHIYPESQVEMDKSIELFNEQYPNIEIQQNVIIWSKVTEYLQISGAAGEMPDCSFFWPTEMQSFVDQGLALDLTPYFEANDNEWMNMFGSPSLLDMGRVNGKIYAVPFRGLGAFLAYNKDLFNELGIDEFPETIDEFEALLAYIASERDGIIPLGAAGNPRAYAIENMGQQIAAMYAREAGYGYRVEGNPFYYFRDYTTTNGPWEKSYATILDWFKKGYFGKDALAYNKEDAQSNFIQGKSAMLRINNNELGPIRALNSASSKPFDIGFNVLPFRYNEDDDFVMSSRADGWFIAADTDVPDETVAFLKFLNTPAVGTIWAEGQGNAPSGKGVVIDDPGLQYMMDNLSLGSFEQPAANYNSGTLHNDRREIVPQLLIDDEMTPAAAEEETLRLIKNAMEDAGLIN